MRNFLDIWQDYQFYKAHRHAIHTVATIVAAAVFLWLGWVILFPTPALESPQRITVKQGQSLLAIANMLEKEGLVRSSSIFRFYVAGLGLERNLKAGTYTIPAGSTIPDIAFQISGGRGESTDIAVFIPEGYNIWEIDKRFAESGLIKEGEFASAYSSREGHLFPDTYRFRRESLLGEIVQKMETNGNEKTTELLGSLSPAAQQRILIIASIIEKEARDRSDMHLVSGVIANRLKIGMKLEIDATVSYGACLRQFKANPLLYKNCRVQEVGVGKEIKIDSPYNSYTRSGLPPGPISNPGLMSIEAALNPRGDYFYYLSTRDGGDVIFSKTGAEHVRNRAKYLGL